MHSTAQAHTHTHTTRRIRHGSKRTKCRCGPERAQVKATAHPLDESHAVEVPVLKPLEALAAMRQRIIVVVDLDITSFCPHDRRRMTPFASSPLLSTSSTKNTTKFCHCEHSTESSALTTVASSVTATSTGDFSQRISLTAHSVPVVSITRQPYGDGGKI